MSKLYEIFLAIFFLTNLHTFNCFAQESYPAKVVDGPNFASDLFYSSQQRIVDQVPHLKNLDLTFGLANWYFTTTPSAAAATSYINVELPSINYVGFVMKMPNGADKRVTLSEIGITPSGYNIVDIKLNIEFGKIGVNASTEIDFNGSFNKYSKSAGSVRFKDSDDFNKFSKFISDNNLKTTQEIFSALNPQVTFTYPGSYNGSILSEYNTFFLRKINNYIQEIWAENEKENKINTLLKSAHTEAQAGNLENAKSKFEEAYQLKADPNVLDEINRIKQLIKEKKEADNQTENGENTAAQSGGANPSGQTEQNKLNNNGAAQSSENKQTTEGHNSTGVLKVSEPYFSNSYDYFSVEEMKKSEKKSTYYIGTFSAMISNDIEQNRFTSRLNDALSQPIPLDPFSIIQNQNNRQQEAISLLEQKQSAMRRAASEQELRAINSASSPLELSVLNGTASVMKVVNEIAFRKEKERLLANLKVKREKEIDKLYRNVLTPLEKSVEAFERKAIYQMNQNSESSALQWRNYYAEFVQKTKQNFSYSNTDWAIPERIKGNFVQPKQAYSDNSIIPSISELERTAKRKMAGLTAPDKFLSGQIEASDFSDQKFRSFFDDKINYRIKTDATSYNPYQRNSASNNTSNAVGSLIISQSNANVPVEKIVTTKDLSESSKIVLAEMIKKDPNNAWGLFHLGLLSYNQPEEKTKLLNLAYALSDGNDMYKEEAYWDYVLMSDDKKNFEDYVKQYPNGIHTAAAQDYLNYRNSLEVLENMSKEGERRNHVSDYKAIRSNPWYRTQHWTKEKDFHLAAAQEDFIGLKNLKDGLYNTENVRIIERYMKTYENTNYVKQAEILLSNAKAKRKFNYFEMNLGFSPITFVNYSEETYAGTSGNDKILSDEAASSIAFKFEMYFHRSLFSLNQKGTLSFGFYGGTQVEFNVLHSSTKFKYSGTYSTDKEYDGRIALGFPVPELEMGIGLSRYLYGIVGYKRYLQNSTIVEDDKEYRLYTHPLVGNNVKGANGWFYGLKSEIPIKEGAIMGSYRKYFTPLGTENRLQFRIYIPQNAKNGAPLFMFFQYEMNKSSSEYLSSVTRITKQLSYNYLTIGLRIGGCIY